LNTAALAAFTTAAPHRTKRRIPPGPDARAAAAVLNGGGEKVTYASASVIDLGQYSAAAARRRTLPADPNPKPLEGNTFS